MTSTNTDWKRERNQERGAAPERFGREPEVMPPEEERRKAAAREHERIQREQELPPAEQGEAPTPAAPANVFTPSKDPMTESIEEIMSEDLGPLYRAMTPEQQVKFKVEGERTASVIRQLVEHVKLGAKSILNLIRKWLRLIPGVNKFFLEQEAKIKTDRVMTLHDRLHHRK